MYSVFVVSVLSGLLPLIAAFPRRKKLARNLTILVFYLVISFCVDFASMVLAFNKINNLWLIRIHTPLEFGLLSNVLLVWSRILPKGHIWPDMISVVGAAILVFLIFLDSPGSFNNLTKGASAVVLLTLSALVLFNEWKSTTEHFFDRASVWISMAVFLFFSVSTVVYGMSNILLTLPRYVAVIPWEVSAIVHIGANLLYTVGIRCQPTQSQS